MKNKTIICLVILLTLIVSCTTKYLNSSQEKEPKTLKEYETTDTLKFKNESEQYQTFYAKCTADLRDANYFLKEYTDALTVCKSKNG